MIPWCAVLNAFTFTTGAWSIKASQKNRPPIFGVFILFWLSTWLTVGDLVDNAGVCLFWSFFLIGYLNHMVNVLFLARYHLPSNDKSWRRAFYTGWNTRWLRTSHEVPLVHSSVTRSENTSAIKEPKTEHKNRMYSPTSRRLFVIKRIGILLARILALFFTYEIVTMDIFTQFLYIDDLQAYGNSSHLDDPTRQVFATVLTALHQCLLPIFETYMRTAGMHDLGAILFVGILRTDDPEDWPPLFGHLSHVYSLKTFWTQFWHQIFYRYAVNMAVWFCANVLKLNPKDRSRMKRSLIGSLIFLLSAINHLFCTWPVDGELRWSLFWWYALLPIAMIAEDFVRGFATKRMPWMQQTKYDGITKCVGWIWILSVFVML